MSRRILLPVLVLAGIAMVAMVTAAAIDRTPEVAATPAGFGAGPVPAGTPVTDGWAEVADLGPQMSPTSDNACERGEPQCLASVLEEMEARLEADGCSHNAPFAFTYQEMTRGVYEAVLEPGFFALPPATVHADALFARLYFAAYDNWAAGRVEDVPAAWRVAFGVADQGNPGAAVDLLLGMNAHISRDLPYVVADIASWQAEAGADSSDFLRINDVIAAVKGPMIQGAAERFDPALALLDFPLAALTAGEDVDIIAMWRNQALERGVRLSRATTEAGREAIEGEIEREALATAVLLLNAGTSTRTSVSRAERDAYCESQRS